MAVKFAALVLAAWFGLVSVSSAAALDVSPGTGSVIRVDWQEPPLLPRQFRNHCSVDAFSGRPYCANHCGGGYQFYFCSQPSFGCCHLGRGYCDWRGHLRCAP
jgi:hypothetical protein